MKRYLLILLFPALLTIAAVTLFAGGGREQAGEVSSQPGEVSGAPGARAQQEMRRLATIGAELRTDGGTYVPVELPPELQDQSPPSGAAQFSTDFSRALISYREVVAGGPPKDGIPAIDSPQFVSMSEAQRWMRADEAVLAVTVNNTTRIYPLQILMWHEIVNDEVGGKPLAVTYCPLCNTGVVFERTFDNQVLDFGVSGRLIYSNMLMYDRQTETWWIQATGRGVAGRYAGQQLAFVPSMLISWSEAESGFADAEVLSFETGYRRDYGRNPYVGYDSSTSPFLYRGPDVVAADSENPMTRVLSVYHGDAVAAVGFPELEAQRVIERELDGTPVVVFWAPGTASALDDGWVSGGRDVGTANAFYTEVNGRSLTFTVEAGKIIDQQTASVWNEAGRAIEGELTGSRLEPALSIHHFLFSWRAFHPTSSETN